MAADNTRKTSNVIHDLATLKTQVETNTNNIANATSPNDGDIKLSVGTGLALGDGSANASANQEANTQWTINLDPDNVNLSKYIKTVDGVSPNSTTGNVDLKSSDDSLKVTPDTTNNTIDLTLNGTIPTVNDKTIGLTQGTGIGITGDNATTNMSANSNQTISLNANLSHLNDVNTSGATTNQALVYNGTQWLPGDVSGGGNGTVKTLDGVGPNTSTGDIDLSSPNGSLTITPDTANHTVKLELNGTIPTVNDGKINMTASNGVKMSSDSANASANQSGNTTFKIEADTDSLNSTLNFAKTTDIGNGSIGIIEGTGINVTGNNATANQSTNSNWTINLNASLSQLTDVSDTAAADKQVLTYNDTDKTWEPAASQTGGVTKLAALDDTDVSTPTDGQVLVWNGTDWENQNASGGGVSNLPISSTDGTVTLDGESSVFTVDNADRQMISVDQSGTDGTHLAIGQHAPAFQGGNAVSGIHVQGREGSNTELKFTTDATTHGGTAGGVISYGNGFTLRDRNKGSGFNFTINTDANAALQAFRISSEGLVVIGLDGTTIAPSFCWKDDVNTGFSRTNEDQVSVICGGQQGLIVSTDNVTVPTQVQTNTITSKDAAKKTDTTPADPVIDLSWSTLNGSVSSPAIAFRAGYYDNKESVVIQQGDGVAPDTANRMNYGQIVSVANNEIGTADDPAFAGMTFRHTYASGSIGTIGVRQTYVDENASTKAEFAFIVRNGNANLEVLTVNHQDIRAKSGYVPQSNDSLVTKGWVTGGGTNATGGYLPLAGGTMDAAADVIIPSGNSVNANLMVGGVVGDTIRDSFNIAARGTLQQMNAQVVAWAKPGGMAYLKLCTTDDISSYWNISGSSADENGTNYLRFSSESQNWVTYSNATTAGDRKITHVPYTEFYGGIGTNTITTKDAAEGDALVTLSQRFFVQVAGAKLDEDTGRYDRQGTFTIQNYYDNVNPIDDDTVLTLNNRSNYYGARIDFANGNSTSSDTGGAVVRASIEKGSVSGQNPNDQDDVRDGHMHYRVYGLSGYNPHHVFHVGGQNSENLEALRLAWNQVTVSTGDTARLTITDDDIQAFSGYEPQSNDSLVTKGWVTTNAGGTLPIYSDNAKARVDYIDNYDDPDKWSLIRLVASLNNDDIEGSVASSLQMDGLGRVVVQASASSSAQPLTNAAFAVYSVTTNNPSSRIGYSNRSKHYGDKDNLDEDSGMENVSLSYGYYSQSQFQDIRIVTAVDYTAVGPQDIGNSAANTCIGFYCQSSFANGIEHPTGGSPLKMGFRSDIVQTDSKQEYAIFVNGTAPSRFNSPIQLTANAYLSDATDNSCQLYTAGGYWNLKQGPSGSPGGGVAFCFRFNDDRQTSNSWLKWSGKDADGNTQNGWFGYEQDAKRYRFLNETGAYSMYEVQVDSKDASFNVANGDTNMLKVSRANGTQTVTRSWTQIATASMPTDWVPSADHNLANKKYVDSRIWKGTQSEYDGLSEYDDDILYCITG